MVVAEENNNPAFGRSSFLVSDVRNVWFQGFGREALCRVSAKKGVCPREEYPSSERLLMNGIPGSLGLLWAQPRAQRLMIREGLYRVSSSV